MKWEEDPLREIGGASPTLHFPIIDNYFGGFVGGLGNGSGAVRVRVPVES